MKHRDFRLWALPMVFLALTSEGLASSWTCQNTHLTRNVTVFYPDAPAPLPCKVYYTKTTENALPRVLWKAQNQEDYCERKAEELVGRLRSLGWECTSDAP